MHPRDSMRPKSPLSALRSAIASLRRWPVPRLVEHDGLLDLRFERGVGQSRMDALAPERLVVDYTRTMLAALLWQPRATRIGVVGLGGGSQVKFLHRWRPRACIEAIEINPRVLALRQRFRIPPDDARLRVVRADARTLLPQRRGAYDLLLLDAYDPTGIPAALSTQAFYDDCRAALAPGGVLAANLFCDDHALHVEWLRQAFDGRVLAVEEALQSNRVAFAWRDPMPAEWRPDVVDVLSEFDAGAREELQQALSLVADAWARRSDHGARGGA